VHWFGHGWHLLILVLGLSLSLIAQLPSGKLMTYLKVYPFWDSVRYLETRSHRSF
jgi:hypothetical protein